MSALDKALQCLIAELGRSDLLIITEAKKELTALRKAAKQMRTADTYPLCPECEVELHLTTAGEHVCRNEVCGLYR